jgi:Rod binding domain-containing protein
MGIDINNGIRPTPVDKKAVDDKKFIPKQYQEVAESMEGQFAEFMLNQMNKAVGENEGEDGNGMDYYKSLQTTERAKMMSKQNNLGLQNVILDQIYPKRMRNEMALKQYEAQANRIHHNLPSYKIDKKVDIIQMGKNDSTPKSNDPAIVGQTREGDLQ